MVTHSPSLSLSLSPSLSLFVSRSHTHMARSNVNTRLLVRHTFTRSSDTTSLHLLRDGAQTLDSTCRNTHLKSRSLVTARVTFFFSAWLTWCAGGEPLALKQRLSSKALACGGFGSHTPGDTGQLAYAGGNWAAAKCMTGPANPSQVTCQLQPPHASHSLHSSTLGNDLTMLQALRLPWANTQRCRRRHWLRRLPHRAASAEGRQWVWCRRSSRAAEASTAAA